MNKPRINPLFALTVAITLALALPAKPQEITRDGTQSKRRALSVTGNGEAAAPPDQAVVRLGTTAQLDEAAAAQVKVNETMQKALDAILKAGIPRRSIRTTGLTLTPIYAPQKSSQPIEPKVVAYRAGNVIEVTVDDLELVGKVIDAGITAGANQLQGVSFALKNDLPQRKRALQLASEEAQTKARTIASALNIHLADIIEVTEGGVEILPQREHFGMARAMAADVRTPVEPGEVRVHASVTVRYEISGGARQ